MLEDMFFFVAPRIDAGEALKWTDKLGKDSSSKTRPDMMKLRAAEILMYYSKNLEGVRKLVKGLVDTPGEVGEWAKIRLGDIAFLSRNLNEATQMYGDVQNRAKYSMKVAEETRKKAAPVPTGLARSKKEFEAQKKKEEKPAKPPAGGSEPLPNVAKWKEDAIRDVAASETIKNLIDQRFYMEAYQALQRWERVYPLSKISGDYVLLESKLYMTLGDYARARAVLEAYCEQVDASNFMAEALNNIKICMVHMNESDANVYKYLDKAKKRLRFQETKF